MARSRLRSYLDAVAVLVCEVAALGLLVKAGPLMGTVDVAHFGRWLQTTTPEVALTALARLLGIAVSAWLLISTIAYGVGVISGKRGLVRRSRRITIPALRRIMDSVAAASVAASSLGTLAAVSGASAPPRPAPVVRPLIAKQPVREPETRRTPAPVAAPVSTTAVGRHFPHPGTAQHRLPATSAVTGTVSEAPSEANGFYGLPRGTKVVVVKPGDCLSVLAEKYLGDWRLDSEIEALNFGRLQPDGRALVNDHWIYPGWVLVMPSDAIGTLVVGGAPLQAPGGEPSQAPERPRPSELHQSVACAPHRVDPEHRNQTGNVPLVARGDKPAEAALTRQSRTPTLTFPSTPPSSSSPASTASPPQARVRPPSATHPHEERAAKNAVSRAGGLLGVAAIPPPSLSPQHGPSLGPAPVRARTSGPDDPHVESSVHAFQTVHAPGPGYAELAFASGIGAIAGAGIVWRLDRLRREQGHRRPKGQAVARNRPEVEAAERRLRAIANADAMRWVDQGVRYLSGLVEQLSFDGVAPVPSLVMVRVGAAGLEVVLSPTVMGSLGWFSPNEEGTALVLDADVTADDLEALAADRWPAWPAIVSLGENQSGTLLLNLEHTGSLSVEGPSERVQSVLARMAVELVSHPWSDEMLSGLYALGGCPLDGRLPGLLTIGDEEASDLAEKLELISGSHQELAGPNSLSAIRAVACEALPNVALAFAGTPPRPLIRLTEGAVPEKSGIALVGAGPYPGARWRLALSESGGGVLEGELDENTVSFEFDLDHDFGDVALLGDALGSAAEPVSGATAAARAPVADVHEVVADRWQGAGHATGTSQSDLEAKISEPKVGEVEICVLGPVDIAGGEMTALEPSRRMAALGLLTYMATHRRPLKVDELASALWPLDASKDDMNGPQRKTVMNVLSRARAVLGYGPGGTERLAYSFQGYTLSGDITCDWDRFDRYTANARRQAPIEAMGSLRKALELVRGEPFAGAMSSQFFEWVASEHLDLTISGQAVDVAEDLGQFALNASDFETVVWAVERGLQLEPTCEELYRLWMHALGRTGRPARVDDVYRRLKMVLRQRLDPLQEPQTATREVWRTYVAAEGAGGSY